MKLEIFTEENEQLYDFTKNKFTFYKRHNEFGDYHQLKGYIKMIFPEMEISIQTETLNTDVFGLLYSVNDYLEFGFVSTTFDDEKIDFEYEGYNSTEIKIIFDKKWYVVLENEFLLTVINTSVNFFSSLQIHTKEEKYKMYVDVAESLKQRIKNESG